MSVRFSGTQLLARSANLPTRDGPWTMMAWVYYISDTGTYQTIFNVDDGSGYPNFAAWGGFVTNVTQSFRGGTGGTHAGVSANTWYHVALVVGATSNQLDYYLNGTLDHSASQSLSITVSRFCIGGVGAASFPLNARVAGVKWWSAALSTSDIAKEKAQFAPCTNSATRQGFYPMLLDNDATVDHSGNGRTLTLTGTLTTEANPPGIPWSTSGLYPELTR